MNKEKIVAAGHDDETVKEGLPEELSFSLSKRLAMFTSDVPGFYAKDGPKEPTTDPPARERSKELPEGKHLIARRYELGKEIGEGGMGRVYEATDHELGRQVAIKVLKADAVEEVDDVHRFYYEAEILARMDHPGILPIISAGFDESYGSYFVMKLVQGDTLSHLLKLQKASTTLDAELIRIFEQVCLTVAYAHEQGFVHRDLKPDNIMVDGFGVVLVMDWGLAKRIVDKTDHDQLKTTGTGIIKGTPLYMSPEQVSGHSETIDFRSDVFALGVLLYEMLTGITPFNADEPISVLMKIKGTEATHPRVLNDEADELLSAICMKALAKSPEERYATAKEMAEDISKYLDGKIPEAFTPTVSFQVKHWAVSHPRVIAVLGTLFFVALFVSSLYCARWHMASQAIEATKTEISLHRTLLSSMHRQREACRKELKDGNLTEDKKKEQFHRLLELESVIVVLHSNSWMLTNQVLRIYGMRRGHNIHKWRRGQRRFLEETIEKEVAASIARKDALTAHLVLTSLLRDEHHDRQNLPGFDDAFRKKLLQKRKKVESALKKDLGYEKAPKWEKYLDWLRPTGQ